MLLHGVRELFGTSDLPPSLGAEVCRQPRHLLEGVVPVHVDAGGGGRGCGGRAGRRRRGRGRRRRRRGGRHGYRLPPRHRRRRGGGEARPRRIRKRGQDRDRDPTATGVFVRVVVIAIDDDHPAPRIQLAQAGLRGRLPRQEGPPRRRRRRRRSAPAATAAVVAVVAVVEGCICGLGGVGVRLTRRKDDDRCGFFRHDEDDEILCVRRQGRVAGFWDGKLTVSPFWEGAS